MKPEEEIKDLNACLLKAAEEIDDLSRKSDQLEGKLQTAWIFDGKDPQGRYISIYIEAPNRESAIAYFESDYEGYRYWQTRQLHSH